MQTISFILYREPTLFTLIEYETHQTTETCVYDPDEFRKTKVFHLNGTFLQQTQESKTNDVEQGV